MTRKKTSLPEPAPRLAFPFDREQLAGYIARDLTTTAVAALHHTTPRTVTYWARRWGLQIAPRIWYPASTPWATLYAQHGSCKAVARVIGCTEKTARQHIRAAGCTIGPRACHRMRDAAGVRARVVELLRAGMTRRDVAPIVGRSAQRVDQIAREEGFLPDPNWRSLAHRRRRLEKCA